MPHVSAVADRYAYTHDHPQADIEMAQRRQQLDKLRRFVARNAISDELTQAARSYLLYSMATAEDSISLIDSLPASIKIRIREERFYDSLASNFLLVGTSKPLLTQMIWRLSEDLFVAAALIMASALAVRVGSCASGHALKPT